MSAVGVVPAFDPVEHFVLGLVSGLENGLVEEFTLKGGEERFGHGIVIAVTD